MRTIFAKMAYTLSNRATELIKELKRSDWIPKYNVQSIGLTFDGVGGWDQYRFRGDGPTDGEDACDVR